MRGINKINENMQKNSKKVNVMQKMKLAGNLKGHQQNSKQWLT